jgi:hypothetical protein
MNCTDADVARAIAGTDEEPPRWLIDRLPDVILGLRSVIKTERDYPGRREMRDRLNALAGAARLVQRELDDPVMLSLLLRGGRDSIPRENDIYLGLEDVAARAEATVEKIPVGRGRNKYHPQPDALSAMDTCALIIGVVWEEARGEWPGVTSEPAHRACDILWGAAGGNVERQGFGSTAVWRDHLEAVRTRRDTTAARSLSLSITK